MPRAAVALLALLAVVPALAGEALFPREGDRWLLDVREPVAPMRERFAHIRGEPDARGGWAVDVTCGTVDLRTGHETVALRSDGVANRSRYGDLGGTYRSPSSPTGTGGFGFVRQDGLDVYVQMPPPCPSGHGNLSSGD